MGNGNRSTPEFRCEAVRRALTSGRTLREIAEDHGIGASTLTGWLSQERHASEANTAPSSRKAGAGTAMTVNVVLQLDGLTHATIDCVSLR